MLRWHLKYTILSIKPLTISSILYTTLLPNVKIPTDKGQWLWITFKRWIHEWAMPKSNNAKVNFFCLVTKFTTIWKCKRLAIAIFRIVHSFLHNISFDLIWLQKKLFTKKKKLEIPKSILCDGKLISVEKKNESSVTITSYIPNKRRIFQLKRNYDEEKPEKKTPEELMSSSNKRGRQKGNVDGRRKRKTTNIKTKMHFVIWNGAANDEITNL